METIGIKESKINQIGSVERLSKTTTSPEKDNVESKNVSDSVEVVGLSSESDLKLEPKRLASKSNNPQTSIRFTVADEGEDNSEINFQVVDKNTGEIIREFPKEDLIKQH